MSKIIKKSDITNLVESTMKEAGILKEGEIESTDVVVEESEEDVVVESVNKLTEEASKHNIISENLKNDLSRFNNIINYKH